MRPLTEPATFDANGIDRIPFDGSYARTLNGPTRSTHAGHGPRCSSNPEIGCVCGEAERQSLRDELASPSCGWCGSAGGCGCRSERSVDGGYRLVPEHTVSASYLAPGDRVRLMGGWVIVESVDLLDGGETIVLHRTDFSGGTHLLCSQRLPANFRVQVDG